MAESDFSASCIIGYDSSSSRCGPAGITPLAKPEISRFPHKELPHMPGSPTTPGWAGTRDDAPDHVAFRDSDHVGTQNFLAFAAQWPAYALPYRRFADTLTSANARLGADADRYSFIVVDLHLLLLAGFDRRTENRVFLTQNHDGPVGPTSRSYDPAMSGFAGAVVVGDQVCHAIAEAWMR
jgi:hypothetical protein